MGKGSAVTKYIIDEFQTSWRKWNARHCCFTGQVFNVNLSYRKAIIITLTTLQLVEKESPYVHCCFYFKITDGEELHCISEVKRGNRRVFISFWQNYRAPCWHPILRKWKNNCDRWLREVFSRYFSVFTPQFNSKVVLLIRLHSLIVYTFYNV